MLYMDGNSGGVDEGTKIAMEHGVKVRSPTPPSPYVHLCVRTNVYDAPNPPLRS